MTKKNTKTLMVFLLDETGSMQENQVETITGFNEYIKGLRESGEDIKATVTLFNAGKVEVRHDKVELADIPDLTNETYRPANWTPLYDAMGKSIQAVGSPKKRNVLFVVMTDGLENASVEFTAEAIQKLVAEKEQAGWQFLYLGANHDAITSAGSVGIQAGNAANYTPEKTEQVFAAMAGAAVAYTNTGGVQSRSFVADHDLDDLD